MLQTRIYLHSCFQIDKVDERIFGGFMEHMGRCIYEGVYDPDCQHSDKNGFRRDVLDKLDKLKMTAMRYPGGNFASGYHWLDGVGPRGERPTNRELAWQSIEPNQFGTDEYIDMCRMMNWTPMLTVNLGTGTAEEARNWVEYCNCPIGTQFSDLRSLNGNEQPHKVKLWCLGNEMDGKWQLGHVPAEQYAIRAQQAAKMIKDVDKTIELVVCGSCGNAIDTYMEWDHKVLEYVGELADYVSLHRYVENNSDDTANFLAVTNSIDQQIEEMDSVCRYVQALNKSKKRAYLCFDEWNVWYRDMELDGEGVLAPHLLEEVYNLEDALVVAGFLNSFIRHADSVKIANIAQIVNVIAPLQTKDDQLLVQSIFYPFEMFSKRRKGISLQTIIDGPTYEASGNGTTTFIDASSIINENKLNLFLTNRSLDQISEVEINMSDRKVVRVESAEILSGTDPKAANSWEEPELLKSHIFEDVEIKGGKAIVKLPALSVSALTFNLDN